MTLLNSSSVSLSVPASSANLGPGFDCLGLALERMLTIKASFEGVGELHDYNSPLDWWYEAVQPGATYTGTLAPFQHVHSEEPNLIAVAFVKSILNIGPKYHLPKKLKLETHSEIPIGNGLGSSAAAIVAGAALSCLFRTGTVDRARLLRTSVEVEGHPDNVAAALSGGLVSASPMPDNDVLVVRHEIHPSLMIALAVPEIPLKTNTEIQRKGLPDTVSHADATANQQRLLALLEGLKTANGKAIACGMEDCLHVPFRADSIPGYEAAVRAAVGAGAFGATISGAGGTLLAFAPENSATAVAEAMSDALEVDATPLTVRPSQAGLTWKLD